MRVSSPFFTVIIPVYNVEQHIQQCLHSVLQQSFHDFELLLIDDCGTDSSIQLAKAMLAERPDFRVRIIKRLTNGGISAVRNQGIENAVGDYLVFVDSDDHIHIDLLADCAATIKEHNVDVVLFGASEYLPGIGLGQRLKGPRTDGLVSGNQALYDLLSGVYDAHVWKTCIRRTLFTKDIRFPERVIFEEMFVLPYIFKNAISVAYRTKVLYYYHQHQGTLTKKVNSYHLSLFRQFERLQNQLSTCDVNIKSAFKRFKLQGIANILLNLVQNAADLSTYQQELRHCRTGIKLRSLIYSLYRFPGKLTSSMLLYKVAPKAYIRYFGRRNKG